MSSQRPHDRADRVDGRALLAAGVGGLLLFLSDYPVELPWLSLVAFVPYFWAIFRARRALDACVFGAVLAVGRFVPLGVSLEGMALPLGSAVGLSLYLVVLEVAFALVVYRARDAPTWAFVLLAAGAYTVLELVDSLLPMYGTARTLARLWSAWPVACGGVRLLGGTAFAFVVVALEALLAVGIERKLRAPMVASLAGLVALVALGFVPARGAERTLRVAAVGWNETSDAKNADRHVAQAAAADAKLVVFPEVAFEVPPSGREPFERRFSALARQHAVALAVPFADHDRRGNRTAVFDATGEKLGEYGKHHLVPLAERFPASDGPLLVFEIEGARIGVLICQDDNFRDLAREYERRRVDLLVVPTFEIATAVAPYHLRSSALRAVENGIAVVRAVAQGQSAAIAPGGLVLGIFDHEKDGPGVLVTDVPVGRR